MLAGAIWRSPQRVQHWCEGLPRNRPLVVYCEMLGGLECLISPNVDDDRRSRRP
jgi:hypothetical protein